MCFFYACVETGCLSTLTLKPTLKPVRISLLSIYATAFTKSETEPLDKRKLHQLDSGSLAVQETVSASSTLGWCLSAQASLSIDATG